MFSPGRRLRRGLRSDDSFALSLDYFLSLHLHDQLNWRALCAWRFPKRCVRHELFDVSQETRRRGLLKAHAELENESRQGRRSSPRAIDALRAEIVERKKGRDRAFAPSA